MPSRMRVLSTLILVVAAGAALAAAGCNDDGGSISRITKPPEPVILDVRPGTWDLSATFTAQSGSCLRLLPEERTMIFCNGVDLDQQAQGLGLNCTFQVDGNRITGTCGGTIGSGDARITYSGSGGGTVTQAGDFFVINMTVNAVLPQDGGTCTYLVNLTGTWQKVAPCSISSSPWSLNREILR